MATALLRQHQQHCIFVHLSTPHAPQNNPVLQCYFQGLVFRRCSTAPHTKNIHMLLFGFKNKPTPSFFMGKAEDYSHILWRISLCISCVHCYYKRPPNMPCCQAVAERYTHYAINLVCWRWSSYLILRLLMGSQVIAKSEENFSLQSPFKRILVIEIKLSFTTTVDSELACVKLSIPIILPRCNAATGIFHGNRWRHKCKGARPPLHIYLLYYSLIEGPRF